ncbi:MAG: TonB-dependent receptor plug domain-containing protein [Myxococcaceae bacterium]|nr:TonB-dependent receptor plug domain-containing protein [Myxococcaceae bacterium]
MICTLCSALLLSSAPLAAETAEPDGGVEPGAAEAEAAADAGAAASEPTEVADESGVTSQVASFAVTRLKDSPAVVTVMTADDIRSLGARDLVDVLNLVPGFFFGVDVQGVVGPGFRGMWGYEGKILLLVDGKEMNELLYSTLQLGHEFPVDLIERVEVVRGPGSVIYGGNAELAVINVVTKGLQGGTELFVSADYGQLPGARNVASGYARRGGSLFGRYVFDSVPGLSGFASASFHQGQRSVRDYVDNDGARGSMEGSSALDPASVQFGLGYRDVQFTFLYQHLGMSMLDGTGPLTPVTPMTFDSLHGDLVGTFRPTERLEIIPRLNFTYQLPWRTADTSNDFYYDKAVWRGRGRLIVRWAPLDQLQVTAGGDAMFDRAFLQGPAGLGLQTRFGDSGAINYQTFGAFLEAYSENPIVNVAAGARYDHNSAVGGALVPRLVLLRSFGPLGLKALFSLAFRWPGIENLNLGVDLTPERTRVFEFEATLDLFKLARLSLNFFDVGISAPIVFSVNPVTGAEGYQNLGYQGSRGVEAAFRIRGRYGRAAATYSLYFQADANNIANYQVAGVYAGAPQHRATAAGTLLPLEWLGISPSLTVLGPRYGFGPPDAQGTSTPFEIGAQVMANLFVRVELPFARGVSVGLGIYNILGTNWVYVQPYDGGHAPLPGLDREVMLKVAYSFEPTYSE